MKACHKVRHASKEIALRERSKIKRKKGITLHAYVCPVCKAWHLGNTVGTRLANLDRIFDQIALRG